ncbi:Clavaminate synthase-like protein [Cutaneotrichosporon oleaginosum]|uniref:Clavaminate synthase-like protein n=1 Tax=Cutaneotrichosporon oleaginosum TaxID=879819 RepID=A0A0J0XET1_9TREE|nr:Clavaminate synthase-like protein [Cutaneotrichosporon oleaginosum]KLT39575.1 Clavaminate synthase-like protein [Cutaneotrichosporon oleaginosum]
MTDAAHPDPARRRAVAAEIRAACLNQGFFYRATFKNHGVSRDVVDAAFGQSHAFFGLGEEVKRSIDISKSSNFRGFMALQTESHDSTGKGDYHEAFNLGLDPSLAPDSMGVGRDSKLQHGENLWPEAEMWDGAAQFKSATLAYYSAILALGQRLFPLIALALDLPEDFFSDKIQHPAAIMRLLFYPALGAAEPIPGIGAHTDFECFTILKQDDVPALQVANRRGEWLDAPCIPDTFVVNIGDQLARWTNDIFVSTRHRVLATPDRDRYSIPFFFGCDHDVVMHPIPTCVSADRPNRYEVMTAGDYVHQRLSEVYAAGLKGPEGAEKVEAK